MSSSDPHGFWQKKRRLRAALGDLQEYSDAPPAVRRLATAAEEEEEEEKEEIEIEEEEEEKSIMSGLNREMTYDSTAPPTPLERQDTQKCPLEGFPITDGGVLEWNDKQREDAERISIARLSDVQQPSSVGGPQRMHEIFSGSPAESPRLIPLISRTRFSPSSSKISLIPPCVQRRRSEVFHACPYRISRRSYSFCCHCAQIFLSSSHLVEEKEEGLQRGQRSFDKSSGNSKNSNESRENRTENTNSTTKCIARQPVLVFKSLGLLPSVMFASSYPRSTVPIRLKKVALRETPNSDKSDGKKEPAKHKSDVMSTTGQHRVKILPLDGEEYPQCTKQRGSESVFSLSTPRRQSTSSLLHCPSSALHPSRQTVLWSPQSQSQQQQQSQQLHSRVFSCSRASSEKTGHSPTSSSTFRPWPSESIEWLQHQLMLQQSHPCNLPVFSSVGAGGESGGESHVGLLSARTNGRYAGNNSISSLLLTRTGSNIDTLPTCCDAPLEAFMDSSSLATSSITTLT